MSSKQAQPETRPQHRRRRATAVEAACTQVRQETPDMEAAAVLQAQRVPMARLARQAVLAAQAQAAASAEAQPITQAVAVAGTAHRPHLQRCFRAEQEVQAAGELAPETEPQEPTAPRTRAAVAAADRMSTRCTATAATAAPASSSCAIQERHGQRAGR